MRDLSVDLGAGQATPTGDWATADGLAARRACLLRRLTTARGALWYDRNYGNGAYARLSQPATAAWMQQIAADCRQAAEGEPGVRVVDVRVQNEGSRVLVVAAVTWDDAVAETLQTAL